MDKKGPTWKEEVYSARLNKSIKGVVTDKYEDKEHHMHKTIEVNNVKHIFSRDVSGLYEFVEVGDSLYKEDSTADIKLIRDSKEFVFKIMFDLR